MKFSEARAPMINANARPCLALGVRSRVCGLDAVAHSLPRWFAARLIEERGEAGAIALAAALAQKAPLTVRRNAIKCASSASLATALAREDVAARVPAESAVFKSTRRGAPDALAFESGRPRAGIFGLETYRRGWFEVQDAGSQCVVSAVTQGVEETCSRRGTADAPLKVLDACCGNGGKTLALASRLSRLSSGAREDEAFDDATRGPESYRIDCFDVDARRLRHLAAATRRAGCERFARVVTKLDLRAVASAKLETNKYDAVLVDAPCSSAGALRRFPSLRWEMEEAKTRFRDTEPSRSDDSERRAFGARGVPARRGKTSSTRDEDAPPRFYDDCNQSHLVDGDVASRPDGPIERPCVRSRRRSGGSCGTPPRSSASEACSCTPRAPCCARRTRTSRRGSGARFAKRSSRSGSRRAGRRSEKRRAMTTRRSLSRARVRRTSSA